ncbi:MAG: DNA-binding response regulator [Anaerocolumna sp.]|jgi:DNA-binding response OmpR family regulator|nr:DNA-binding response regulator [Anaerocolumna sp.]
MNFNNNKDSRQPNIINMNRVLILEDEDSVNRSIAFLLEKEGYEVYSCYSLGEARGLFQKIEPQLIICDITLPDGSGLMFIREVRKVSQVHIICLTAMDREADQVIGYEAGADDYVTKPFSLSVLTMKVAAYFRRHSPASSEIIESGRIKFSISDMRVQIDGYYIDLTKNEWKLLRLFLEHPKQILSKNQILEQLFDMDGSFADENTVAVNIRRLREKIEPDSAKPEYIKNIRGMGYLWNQECRRNI